MNDADCILSIDLGTSSCKLALVDSSGSTLAAVSEGYPTWSEKAGWAEQDPEDWLQAVSKAAGSLLRETAIDAGRIAALIPTCAAHIGVLTDDSGRGLRRALLWSDQRSSMEVEELKQRSGDFIFEKTCNQVAPTWTLPHFLWIQRNDPEVLSRVKRVTFSKDYLIHHLTGAWTTDFSTAVSSMLCDTISANWSEELVHLAGLNIELMPRITPPDEIVGVLHARGAAMLGLREGTPVLSGALDSAMETWGAGARRPGDYVIRIGTAGGIHIIKQNPDPVRGLLTYPYLTDNLWYSQAGTNSAGSAINWAMATAGLERNTQGYAELEDLASNAPPGCEALFFHPYLSGERTPYWNPDLRGTFTGISFRHGKAHFARAVLEGVAFSLFDALSALGSTENLPEKVLVVGGGGSNKVLMKILSSLLNRELQTVPGVDSCYGAAVFGLKSMGQEAAGTAMNGTLYIPEADLIRIYRESYDNYTAYAKSLCALYQPRIAGGEI